MLDYAWSMLRTLFLYLLCITPLLAAEMGYRIVHPDGTVEFTDQPVEGAEPITLPAIPTYSTPASPAGTTDAAPASKAPQEEAAARTIAIVSPMAEETVWFSESGMTVSVQVTPALGGDEQVLIRLDGSEAARGTGSSFTLKQVYRGSHTLSAALTDNQGGVISESTPITFYMRQHTAK